MRYRSMFGVHQHEKGQRVLCHHCNAAEGYLRGNTEVMYNLIGYMNKSKDIFNINEEDWIIGL